LLYKQSNSEIHPEQKQKIEILLKQFQDLIEEYKKEEYAYSVRGKTVTRPLFNKSLSNTDIPKIAFAEIS